MSVGGIVVGVVDLGDGKLRVETIERTRPKQRTSVNVSTEYDVQFGDKIWWQGGFCYWTRSGEFVEKKIPRLGYSY